MRLQGIVEKGWGSEDIWATNDKYCGKILYFKEGKRFSMHFHKEKDESWYVLSGEFAIKYIDTKTARVLTHLLMSGDTWRNPPLQPHQLVCIKEGSILEVSTPDSVEDNYRVYPGDSQIADFSNGS